MLAQTSLEFLLISAASLAVVAALSAAILAAEGVAMDRIGEARQISHAESEAVSLESAMACGPGFSMEAEVARSVEDGRMHVAYHGKVIEVGGVFSIDKDEPA